MLTTQSGEANEKVIVRFQVRRESWVEPMPDR